MELLCRRACHWRDQRQHSACDEHPLVDFHCPSLHFTAYSVACCPCHAHLALRACPAFCRLIGTFTFAIVLGVVTEDIVNTVIVSLSTQGNELPYPPLP